MADLHPAARLPDAKASDLSFRRHARMAVQALVLLLSLLLGMGGTAHAQPAGAAATAPAGSRQLAPGFSTLMADDKIVLVPMDVELFELSAGGVAEPKADWTAAAQRFMRQALADRQARMKVALLEMSEREADEFAEQLGLQAAVARSIAVHHLMAGAAALPTKAGQLNWSLGDAMQPLAARTGARYGLFIWVRDSYASAERKAVMVGLALLGVGISGGVQIGLASLVDLRSGQVVWMNQLARMAGDLRDAKAAEESMASLLTGFPDVR
ncbi:MAG: hypothetical protein JNJ71_16260 [Rubrivivax sp.]|nr:hypothetical protein [Rubrivivax sp.]